MNAAVELVHPDDSDAFCPLRQKQSHDLTGLGGQKSNSMRRVASIKDLEFMYVFNAANTDRILELRCCSPVPRRTRLEKNRCHRFEANMSSSSRCPIDEVQWPHRVVARRSGVFLDTITMSTTAVPSLRKCGTRRLISRESVEGGRS